MVLLPGINDWITGMAPRGGSGWIFGNIHGKGSIGRDREWLDLISKGFSNLNDPTISGKQDGELGLERSRSQSSQLMGNPGKSSF